MADKEIVKHCITCEEDGHTYLECRKAPFASIVADAFGLPVAPPKPPEYDETMKALRERVDRRAS